MLIALLTSKKSFLIKLGFFVLAFTNAFTGYTQSQTSFKDMGSNTPNYQVIQRVVKSKRLKLAKYYKNFKSGHYYGAWQKVDQYFPKNFYYNSSTTNFMHHWFNPKGKLEMSVYQSKELKRAVQNLETFHDRNIVNAYKSMRKKKDLTDANSFKEKLGLLEKYFLNDKDKAVLKKYLGSKLYKQMLRELREEGDHMFAAALLHEGMHAKVDNDATVAKIHNDFTSCKTPVQWDEFRGYMSEIGYHANYFRWSAQNINAHWGRINKLLKDLEKHRKKGKPKTKREKAKLEAIKAKIKAHIAMIRVRLREMQQSIDRMKNLMDYFQKNYVKSGKEKEYKNLAEYKKIIDGVQKRVNDFAAKAQKTIDDLKKKLKDLEDILKTWNVWASCQIPKPPSKEKHEELVKKFKDVTWPTPPETEAEKKEAEKKITGSSGSTKRSHIQGPTGNKENSDSDETIEVKEKTRTDAHDEQDYADEKKVAIATGVDMSSFKMDALNDYFNYLNTTWNGNIRPIDSETGFWINVSWKITNDFSLGVEYSHFSSSSSGILQTTGNSYTSYNTLSSIDITAAYNIPIGKEGLSATFKLGSGPYWSDYTETEGSFRIHGNGSTFGLKFSSGLTYSLNHWFQITGLAGFRSATFNNYDNDVEFFNPSNPEVEIDFSGFHSQMGFQIKF